jgi:GPH family glycoside/pentoside/hexuronide:cation symporter
VASGYSTGESPALTGPRKAALGLGDFGFNFYWQSATLYLLYFYTDVVKLAPALAGAIYMWALVWDAALDPVIGLVADRTRSRLGRYRPYLLFGAPVLAVGFVAAMAPPVYPAAGAVLVTVVTHFAFRTLYAVVSVPYAAMSARITRDAAVRADITGFRIVGATLAGTIVATATLPVAQAFPGRSGWYLVSAAYGLVATVVIYGCAVAARGLDAATLEDPPAPPSVRKLASIAPNYPLWLVIGAVIATAFSTTLFGKNVIYYFKYVVGDARLGSLGLGVGSLAGAVAAPMWAALARARGKRVAWLCGLVPSVAGVTLFRLADGHGIPLLFAALILVACGTSAYAVCFWAMLPDTVEYGEWRSGVRAESLVFGVVVLGQKTALGFAAGLLGWLLTHIGYVAGQTQAPETLARLKDMMLVGPLASAGLTAVLVGLYPLTPDMHHRLNEQIEARARALDVEPQAAIPAA